MGRNPAQRREERFRIGAFAPPVGAESAGAEPAVLLDGALLPAASQQFVQQGDPGFVVLGQLRAMDGLQPGNRRAVAAVEPAKQGFAGLRDCEPFFVPRQFEGILDHVLKQPGLELLQPRHVLADSQRLLRLIDQSLRGEQPGNGFRHAVKRFQLTRYRLPLGLGGGLRRAYDAGRGLQEAAGSREASLGFGNPLDEPLLVDQVQPLSSAAPGVRRLGAMFRREGREGLDRLQAVPIARPVPGFGSGEFEVRTAAAFFVQSGDGADHAVRGFARRLIDAVQEFREPVEIVADIAHAIVFGFVDGLGLPEFQGLLQIRVHMPLVGLVRMEFETERAQAAFLEAVVDHVQGGSFLGDEQDLLAVRGCVGDDVRDRLRLAGSGRTLDDQILALARRGDDLGLGGVGVQNMPQILGVRKPPVEVLVRGENAAG